jgi:LysM repeat protein
MNGIQAGYARRIVAVVKQRKLPIEAAYCAVATALVESNLTMYANGNNPESLNLPHDAVSWDHGSVGLFQQQVGGATNSTANWGTTAQLMNVESSTNRFLDRLVEHDYKSNMGVACQLVQDSAFPDRYTQRMHEAVTDVNAIWGGVNPSPTPASNTYTVRTGDTLSSIAAAHHTTWQVLQNINHIVNPNKINVGQVLHLPTTSVKTYTVKPGDNLSSIAATYHTTVQRLKDLNHISDPNFITAGQILKLA